MSAVVDGPDVLTWSESPAEPRVEPLRLVLGSLIGGRWQIISNLTRRGSSAEVYKVVDETGIYGDRVFALKLIVPHLSRRQLDEVSSLVRQSDSRLVKMVDAGHHGHLGPERRLFIVMEWADLDLSQLTYDTGELSDEELRQLVADVLEGLTYLHATGIHRDIKPANILRCGGEWKLGDFGLYAKLGPGARLRVGGSIGTPNYAAPELLGRNPVASVASDVFAVGATVHRVLTGQAVWPEAAMERRRTAGTPPQLLALSPHLGDWTDFVASACAFNPEERPDIFTLKSRIPGERPSPPSPQREAAPGPRPSLQREAAPGPPPSPPHWPLAVLLSLVVAAAVLWVGYAAFRGSPDESSQGPSVATSSIPVAPPLTTTPSPAPLSTWQGSVAGLDPQTVRSWCTPREGPCSPDRFVQQVLPQGRVDLERVHMKTGKSVSLDIPSGYELEAGTDCVDNLTPGSGSFSAVCVATIRKVT